MKFFHVFMKFIVLNVIMILSLELCDRFSCYVGACKTDDAAERAGAIFLNPILIIYVTIFWVFIFPISKKLAKTTGDFIGFFIVISLTSLFISGAMAEGDVSSFVGIFSGIFLPWIIAAIISSINYKNSLLV
ncbi:hypothetical protein ACFOLJ_06435 [Rugamonas sp. CCM 8940]|uniref:hypothetical protein n=1 Tax=Rugamonas sp. CCM 8940 TaxID=2765359 RepID=UPI0018F518E7|nr:hypothetical protein [Rugamonas sp. CCM 8940]MBJ7310408.1 hypothetical protein [Rugamonas sp. CCM 8940]